MKYDMGKIGIHFDGLLSVSEAAKIWNIDESTIRKAIVQGRLVDGRDCRKFGKQWVVTVAGMAKAFQDKSGPSYSTWTEYLSNQNHQQNGLKSSYNRERKTTKKAPERTVYRLLKELVKSFRLS